MKEYIRTTHNFNNDTRKWEYRGDRGCEKFETWKNIDICDDSRTTQWSFGVHALKSDTWMSIGWIIDETISMFKGDAAGNIKDVELFIKNNPNYREIIQKDVEDELKFLVEIDQVRETELII